MSATLRTATPADEPALAALWGECFVAPHLPALYALDPDRHHRTFVAEQDGRIDAVVVYVPRQLRDAHGVPQRVGGLGSVATRPEARGQGLIRRLLVEAERTMTAELCAWSLLFTGTPGVYRGSGWQEFPSPVTEGTITRGGPRPHGRFRIRTATPADGPALAALRAAYDEHRPLSSVRTDEEWAVRIPAWYGPLDRTLVAEDPDSHRIVSMLVTHHGEQVLEVRECAVDPRAPQALGDLLAAAAARSRDTGPTRARVRLPDTAEVRAALPRLLTDAVAGEEHVGMARPLLADPAAVRATVTAPGAVHWYGDSF